MREVWDHTPTEAELLEIENRLDHTPQPNTAEYRASMDARMLL
jgi:hypothetical protein